MVDRGVVQRKVQRLLFCLERIKTYQGLDVDAFRLNQDAVDITVHNLFVILQQLTDLATHVISDDNLGEIGYISDVAEILRRQRILSESEAAIFKKMLGFRNIIAHEYGDLDLRLVHQVLKSGVPDIMIILERILGYAGV